MSKNEKENLVGKQFEELELDEMNEVQGAGDTEGEIVRTIPTIIPTMPATISLTVTIKRKY